MTEKKYIVTKSQLNRIVRKAEGGKIVQTAINNVLKDIKAQIKELTDELNSSDLSVTIRPKKDSSGVIIKLFPNVGGTPTMDKTNNTLIKLAADKLGLRDDGYGVLIINKKWNEYNSDTIVKLKDDGDLPKFLAAIKKYLK